MSTSITTTEHTRCRGLDRHDWTWRGEGHPFTSYQCQRCRALLEVACHRCGATGVPLSWSDAKIRWCQPCCERGEVEP